MGIQKFKSFEEAEKALWCYKPDQVYFERVKKLFNLTSRLYTLTFYSGIFKYSSITEANQQRDEWELKNALKIRERRTKK